MFLFPYYASVFPNNITYKVIYLLKLKLEQQGYEYLL